jgi:hypothetical protein
VGTSEPCVKWDEDGPPIVRILGASLRRAAKQPTGAVEMCRLRGRVAIRSTVDAQSATISFDRGSVHVARGVAGDADLVVAANLNATGRPGSRKPRVSGAIRHPRLALGVSRVLDAPPPGGWPAAIDELWDWSRSDDGRPRLLRVVDTDDGREHTVGQPGGTRVEVHGPGWALLGVFTGADHLGAALVEGRVCAVGEFPALTRLVGVTTRFMLGEEPAR